MIKIERSNEFIKILYHYGLLQNKSKYKIICPFHNDVNASLLINLKDKNFHCFGCGISGDALKFVQLIEKRRGLNDLEACQKYIQILRSKNSQIEHIKIKPIKKKSDKQYLIEAMDYYYNLSKTDWTKPSKEREYLLERGFSVETLQKAGAKINYNNSYPIIFPLREFGEFKGYVCRTMDPNVESNRKYLYNPGFSRATTLVGNYKNYVVVVVEGYLDYLKMKQHGVKYVVALLGWYISEGQIEKLKNAGVKYIVSALDNDEYGEKGTKRLEKYFTVIRFQFPKNIKDPGDLTYEQFKIANRKTKEIFKEVIKNG